MRVSGEKLISLALDLFIESIREHARGPEPPALVMELSQVSRGHPEKLSEIRSFYPVTLGLSAHCCCTEYGIKHVLNTVPLLAVQCPPERWFIAISDSIQPTFLGNSRIR